MKTKKKVFLLLLGQESCHDADEFQGIYTNIEKLKTDYEQLLQGRGTDYENYLKPMVYEFILNDGNENYHIVSEKELDKLWI